MLKHRALTATLVAAVTGAGLVIAGTGGAASAASGPVTHVLAGSNVPFTSSSQATGTVPGSRQLTIQLWLTPRIAAAEAYATAVSTPGTASYGKYLAPDAYTARFGPTAAEVTAAASWLRSRGFTGISAGAQRDYVRATGTVSAIDSAFGTQLRYYPASHAASGGRYRLYANDSSLTVPSSLASSVVGVTGLENAEPVQPLLRQQVSARSAPSAAAAPTALAPSQQPTYLCSSYWGQYTATLTYKQNGTYTYPTANCGYSAKQFRSAYGQNFANTGKGRTIALVELGLTPGMFTTLQKYAAANGMPPPAASRYKELSLGGTFAACDDPFYVEESLDVEAAYDMAPGATELVVGGNACDTGDAGLQGIFDADLAVLNGNGKHPLATVASNSWESGAEYQAASFTNIEHAYLVKAAAEGVGMYFSSGDASGVEAPSSDPYAISVGGTSLGIGKTGARVFETGWSTNAVVYDTTSSSWIPFYEVGAAGGGPSLLWKQPAYQQGVVPKALATPPGNRGGLVRSAPDISADADPFTGVLILLQDLSASGSVTGYEDITVGGTSVAAPLVAGMVTAAEQGVKHPFGFIDPVLYRVSRTAAITDSLPAAKYPLNDRQAACDAYYCGALGVLAFDDQSYDMIGYTGQVTLRGYDNMTGVGMPGGQAFIAALRHSLK
jgi:subtilase family serine protease